MTLPSNGKKLTENEEKSMKIALEQADIRAIHPERMEALADSMVAKLKKAKCHKCSRMEALQVHLMSNLK